MRQRGTAASLLRAVSEGDLASVRGQLLANPSLSKAESPSAARESALHIASREGSLAIVVELLEHGALVNNTDLEGCTALHRASEEGHLDVANALIRAGADASVLSCEGRSALTFAWAEGHDDVCAALLDSLEPVELEHIEMAWLPTALAESMKREGKPWRWTPRGQARRVRRLLAAWRRAFAMNA
jgi:uncharacterized protein